MKFLILPILMLLSSFVYADVAYTTPPINVVANAPNGVPIEYKVGRNTYTVSNTNLPKSNNTSSDLKLFNEYKVDNGNVKATKTNPIKLTDNYGNTAKGTVTTSTNVGSVGTLNKMFAGYAAGQITGSVVGSNEAQKAAAELKNGNYMSAALNAAAAFDVFGIGKGINGLVDAFTHGATQAERLDAEIQAAAKAKAEAAAEQAELQNKPIEYNPNHKYIYLGYLNGELIYTTSSDKLMSAWNIGYDSASGQTKFCFCEMIDGNWVPKQEMRGPVTNSYRMVSYPNTLENHNKYNSKQLGENNQTIEDYMLTQNELMALIADYLNRNLEKNEELLNGVVNALWQANQLNANNTKTEVMGSKDERTFTTAPYTPSGSNEAQQTQFVINNNGDTTVNYIKRSDLKANSSQAPTRSAVGNTNNTISSNNTGGSTGGTGSGGVTNPTKPTNPIKKIGDDDDDEQQQQQSDVCSSDGDDEKVMCLPAGSDDYTDLDVPDSDENISFKKKEYFAESGSCPQSITLNILGISYEISYSAWCEMASGIRPVVELLGVMSAMLIVYGAVREI